jgi:hypothetical protein
MERSSVGLGKTDAACLPMSAAGRRQNGTFRLDYLFPSLCSSETVSQDDERKIKSETKESRNLLPSRPCLLHKLSRGNAARVCSVSPKLVVKRHDSLKASSACPKHSTPPLLPNASLACNALATRCLLSRPQPYRSSQSSTTEWLPRFE